MAKPRNAIAVKTGQIMSATVWPFVASFLHCQLEFLRATHEISRISDKVLSGFPSRALPHAGVVFLKIFIMKKNPVNHRLPRKSPGSTRLHRSFRGPRLR